MNRESQAKLILQSYAKGLSCWEICNTYGLSDSSFYEIINKYPEVKKASKIRRDKILRKKRQVMKKTSKKDQVKLPRRQAKLSDAEKIKQLESMLKQERSKLKEMEALLEVANETLGKYSGRQN